MTERGVSTDFEPPALPLRIDRAQARAGVATLRKRLLAPGPEKLDEREYARLRFTANTVPLFAQGPLAADAREKLRQGMTDDDCPDLPNLEDHPKG